MHMAPYYDESFPNVRVDSEDMPIMKNVLVLKPGFVGYPERKISSLKAEFDQQPIFKS